MDHFGLSPEEVTTMPAGETPDDDHIDEYIGDEDIWAFIRQPLGGPRKCEPDGYESDPLRAQREGPVS